MLTITKKITDNTCIKGKIFNTLIHFNYTDTGYISADLPIITLSSQSAVQSVSAREYFPQSA